METDKTINYIKKSVRLSFSIYGAKDSLNISRDVIRILGFPKFVSIRIKDKNHFAVVPSDVKEQMSFSVPKNLFTTKSGQFRITSKGFVTTILARNNLDKNVTYIVKGTYSEKENVVFFNMENHRIVIDGKTVKENEK
ncbi:hypothetical protein IJ674_00525 [bacterium]|nr:hypothetical protein [bacterium]